MDSIIIRRIVPEDDNDVCLLGKELGYTYPKEKQKDRIRYIIEHTRDIILVAVEGEEVVGYIHGSPYELLCQDSIMNILGFVVKEKFRGNGIGHKLMSELENVAELNGFAGIRLTSGSGRIVAHRFYENHGFIREKTSYKFIKNI